ncbi:NAD-dependent succinate-semialdehyde dehydrogenase [Limibacillus sp. MBR-115]|jgi:aspartate-semialdehyde dehydrogenase|uniref:NAD-dependent succinate-semialdehyde dehydrogenase n=1 Tax=Limibacillus sp. MBR-115 TaxID=3156465 RepID=UPI003395F3A3
MKQSAMHVSYSRGLDSLSDTRLWCSHAYIDGRWEAADSGSDLMVYNPANGALLGQVPAMGVRETERAIAAARTAFSSWRRSLPHQRAALLQAWHREIIAAKQDLALIMVLEQGKPFAEALGEIDYAADFVAWYAEEAKRSNMEGITSHLPDAEMKVVRQPLGVVALITPWNFPCAMITRKAAAAVAAGCTTVIYPSPETPFSALALAVLAERAGLPAGLINVVTGHPTEIGSTLATHADVRGVSFTGSTEVGRLIAKQGSATVKRLVLELGGHAPFIVFSDADLEKAVDSAISAKFATSGQDCLAANRIYVQRPVYDDFLKAYADRIRALKLGEGLEPGVDIGPLIHERAVTKVERQVDDAMAKGAKLLVGGKRTSAGSLFYQPTLLADLPDDALMAREETFGPVAAVSPFDEEAEVLSRANATEFGLVAYLHSRDPDRIHRMTRDLEFGMVAVNRTKITGAPIPFGGMKQSGLGREGSRLGMEAFTEVKYICLDRPN